MNVRDEGKLREGSNWPVLIVTRERRVPPTPAGDGDASADVPSDSEARDTRHSGFFADLDYWCQDSALAPPTEAAEGARCRR